MTDAEREEVSRRREGHARWKLSEAGYRVTRYAGRYVVTTAERICAELDDLSSLVAYANAISADHWTQPRITPSA